MDKLGAAKQVIGGTWQKPDLPRPWELVAQDTRGHTFLGTLLRWEERGLGNQDREFKQAGALPWDQDARGLLQGDTS